MDAKELGARAWNEQTVRMSMAENILCALLGNPSFSNRGRSFVYEKHASAIAKTAVVLADALLEELADG